MAGGSARPSRSSVGAGGASRDALATARPPEQARITISTPSRPRVALGDSDRQFRRDLAALLAADGRFRVCAQADDAPGLLAATLEHRPEVCVLETLMPGGLEAAWEIGARLPRTHLVVLTSSEQEEHVLETVRLGISGYLLKSADLSRLPHALADICGGTFTMPRALTAGVVRGLRTTEARRRSVVAPGKLRLTSREWEVIHLIGTGLSTRDVSDRLGVSSTAVRVHIAAVVRKLGARDRADAVARLTEAVAPERA